MESIMILFLEPAPWFVIRRPATVVKQLHRLNIPGLNRMIRPELGIVAGINVVLKCFTHMMSFFKRVSVLSFVFSAASFAQILGPVSLGVKAGVPITDVFHSLSPTPDQSFYSSSKNYILGPSIEVRLPHRTSVEFDALYRPLTFGTSLASVINGSPVMSTVSTELSNWEFPLMFKYHLVTEHPIRPYVEVGPSFRTGARPLSYLSGTGVTAGVGTDFKVLFFRLSPEFRYTHWSGDNAPTLNTAPLASRLDQVEFLFGLSF